MFLLNNGEWLLVAISFVTSVFTAVFGLGGGILLWGIDPFNDDQCYSRVLYGNKNSGIDS